MPFNATRHRKKTFRQRLTVPVLALALFGYFGFHALNGELGLVGKARIEKRYAELERELNGLVAEREHLERRVSLLRPESLDPDMIDERARASLNVALPGELVILRPAHAQVN